MKCPTCGLENESTAAFCDQCGAALTAAASQTAPAQPQVASKPPAPMAPPSPPESVAMPIVPFHLMVGNQSVAVPLKKEVVIGRADPGGAHPDVDLSSYGGTSNAGVSRGHAKFVWQGRWMIEDMNSTNGTFLRGQRLFPGTQTPINNGEVFQIGKLDITFFAQ